MKMSPNLMKCDIQKFPVQLETSSCLFNKCDELLYELFYLEFKCCYAAFIYLIKL